MHLVAESMDAPSSFTPMVSEIVIFAVAIKLGDNDCVLIPSVRSACSKASGLLHEITLHHIPARRSPHAMTGMAWGSTCFSSLPRPPSLPMLWLRSPANSAKRIRVTLTDDR